MCLTLEYFLKTAAIISIVEITKSQCHASETATVEGFVDEDINAKNTKSVIFDEILEGQSQYDTKIRPLGINGSGPVTVYIDVNVRSIENVDDTKMEYTAQVVYRQLWLDPRLHYEHLIHSHVDYLQLVLPKRIWSPDVFFENEKSGRLHELVRDNVFCRIYPNGTVLQSYRFSILLACPMDLRSYPLDLQVCPFRLANYGYTTQDVELKWRSWNPVQHMNFVMPQFSIVNFTTHTCSSVTASGNYSCIGMDIKLKRAFGFFLIQIYIPCAMLVLVSWVSFWLEPTAVEARVSLGVTSILTIVSQTYGINRSVPPASYIKALDVWMAICQLLVFGGLLQFALVNYMTRLTLPDAQGVIKRIRSLAHLDENPDLEDADDEGNVESFDSHQKNMMRAKRVDKLSRIGFPAVFFFFNIAYWTSYGFNNTFELD